MDPDRERLLRTTHSGGEAGGKHDFADFVSPDSGIGTLSSEDIPDEIIDRIVGHGLTAEDVERAFEEAAAAAHPSDRISSTVADTTVSSSTSGKLRSSGNEKKKSTTNHNFSLSQLRKSAFIQDEDGDTDLHLAIINKHMEAARTIISLADSPSCLDVKNHNFQTPLYLASATNQPEIIRLLLRCHAKPQLRNGKGFSPLHVASKYGFVKCIEEIIRGSPTTIVNLRDYEGNTALHLAARHNQPYSVQLLLKLHANPNEEEDCSGYTALHISVMNGHSSVVRALLSHPDTDPNQANFAGIMPLDIAVYCSYPLVARILEKAGAIQSEEKPDFWALYDLPEVGNQGGNMSFDDSDYDRIILL